MSYWVILALLSALLAVGCKKQDSGLGAKGAAPGQLPEPTAPPSPRGSGPIADAATNPAVIADTGDVNATVQRLTAELRDYVVRTRSVPRNFEEFAAKSQLQFPPAPAGKKYAIEGQVVVLVKE